MWYIQKHLEDSRSGGNGLNEILFLPIKYNLAPKEA
jgi:hypothetical protein